MQRPNGSMKQLHRCFGSWLIQRWCWELIRPDMTLCNLAACILMKRSRHSPGMNFSLRINFQLTTMLLRLNFPRANLQLFVAPQTHNYIRFIIPTTVSLSLFWSSVLLGPKIKAAFYSVALGLTLDKKKLDSTHFFFFQMIKKCFKQTNVFSVILMTDENKQNKTTTTGIQSSQN